MMDLFEPIFRAEARVVGVENIPTTPVTLLESLFPGLGNCLQIKLPRGEFFCLEWEKRQMTRWSILETFTESIIPVVFELVFFT